MTATIPPVSHPAYLLWVDQRLTDRDRAIITTLAQVRVATSTQLERFHFHDLAPSARARIRRRVLARLVTWRVLASAPRRVGGPHGGATNPLYILDTPGYRLAFPDTDQRPAHRPRPLADAFLTHTLAITELYVRLVELCRDSSGDAQVEEFVTEAAAWARHGRRAWVKPDAYLILSNNTVDDHWWIEVDQATQHTPVIRRKIHTYLNHLNLTGHAPHGVMPRILFTVPNQKRRDHIHAIIHTMPQPAPVFFHVTLHNDAPQFLIHKLRE